LHAHAAPDQDQGPREALPHAPAAAFAQLPPELLASVRKGVGCLRAGGHAGPAGDTEPRKDLQLGLAAQALRVVAPETRSGHPFRSTVVRMPGLSWIEKR
jgi:hypothetical protein